MSRGLLLLVMPMVLSMRKGFVVMVVAVSLKVFAVKLLTKTTTKIWAIFFL
jgi:hypothetical protein